MLKLFFKSAIRNLFKNKVHSFLNIAGLALGLSAFLYIATYIFHETSYDNFHSKADRIYRGVADLKLGEEVTIWTGSEIALAASAKNDLPEVEAATRVFLVNNVMVSYDEQKMVEPTIVFADSNLFEVFDFKLLEGNPETVLARPNNVLLNEAAARKYFKDENPVGKSLLLGDRKDGYLVTGILDEVPKNSHLQFEMLASFSSVPLSKTTGHNAFAYFAEGLYTYMLIREGTDMSNFQQKYDDFGMKYWAPNILEATGKTVEEFEAAGNYQVHKPQPLQDIHLNAKYAGGLSTTGNARYLIILAITGILILVIACFNFINLSTAQASLRAKEIGIKKMVGSSRQLIMVQILSETFIHCLIALALALAFLNLVLPVLNNYSEIVIEPEFFLNPLTLITLVTVPLFVTLLAGGYPAFYITRFKIEDVIKGKFNFGRSKNRTRGSLVAFQFVVFMVLVFSTIVIRKQLTFLQEQNPGFNKENVLVIKNAYRLENNSNPFKNELLKNSKVLSATYSSAVPSVPVMSDNSYSLKGSDNPILMSPMQADYDFQKTFKVEMKEGRFFSDDFQTDSQHVIINEEAARRMGITDWQNQYIHANYNERTEMKIIGIMKNFHLGSLRERPAPMVLTLTDHSNYISMRVQPGNIAEVVASVKQQWSNFNDEPIEYFFLDKAFDAQYKSENRLAKIIGLFTIIAILIACFGLSGLISYTANRKRKEIGIRKINGARIADILTLLNKDFALWVMVAFVIAMPIAYYAMDRWLENFAYRTELNWWIMALAGISALVIAIVTVSWQSYKAASINPVDAIRNE